MRIPERLRQSGNKTDRPYKSREAGVFVVFKDVAPCARVV